MRAKSNLISTTAALALVAAASSCGGDATPPATGTGFPSSIAGATATPGGTVAGAPTGVGVPAAGATQSAAGAGTVAAAGSTGAVSAGTTGITGSAGAAVSGAAGAGPSVGAAGASAGAAAVGGVTYHKDIRPVIEQNCLACHVAGGVGPFPLDSFAAVSMVKGIVVQAVTTGKMPPWPASSDCRDIADSRALSEPTKQLFDAWSQAGFPEGNEADYKAMPVLVRDEDIGPATLTLAPATGYTPPNNADDYHCFSMQHTFDQDTYLAAIDIVPDQRAEVHHVQVHRMSAASLQADSGAGYPCTTTGENMFSWRPGGSRLTFEKGDAAYIEKGSAIMLQVHYNTQFLQGKAPTLDKTALKLWTLPEGQIPDRIIYRNGILNPSVNIPANNPHVLITTTSPMSELSTVGGASTGLGASFGGTFVAGEIVGMTPHAHQIASRMDATFNHAGGQSECLIDVPVWDYHWQLDYMFTKPVPYTAQDSIVANCEYDNSAAHQPIVNGEMQTPRNVTFGEGSLDEMCLHYVWLRFQRDDFLRAKGAGGGLTTPGLPGF